LEETREKSQGHRPTAELIKRAEGITDPDERRRVIGEILELRKRYAWTDAEFKAPNGHPSGLIAALGEELGRQAWYSVRTPSFKKWFGDWERAARISFFENSEDIPLNGNAYQGKYELTKESIRIYLKNTLAKTTLRNPAIDEVIRLGGTGIDKLTSWGMNNDIYKKLFAHIPEITEKSTLLGIEKPHKKKSHYRKYSHLAGGLKIDGDPYTVHIILGESGGQWYYSHILLHIKKGSLLEGIRQPNPGRPKPASLNENGSVPTVHPPINEGHPEATSFSDIKDTALLRLLQADSSKIIDGNGEPRPVFRGDRPGLGQFSNPQGIFFFEDKSLASSYSSGGLYELFLDVKNPLVLDENSFYKTRRQVNDLLADIYEKDWSELENDSTYQALRKNYLAFRNGEGSKVRDFYDDFLPKVSEDTPLDEFKEILLKSVHDANAFEWRNIDYHDIDILNPFIKALGYDGVVRPYDPLGQGGVEFISFEPQQVKSATANSGAYSNADPSFTDKEKPITDKELIMANTYGKEISKKVQEHILESFDSYGDMVSELTSHQNRSGNDHNFGGDMVDSGFFLVYNDDIRKFLHGLTGETPEAQEKKYSVDQTYKFYRGLINREAPNVLSDNDRNYIRPDRLHEENQQQETTKKTEELRNKQPDDLSIEQAKKAGYVQGVCECVAVVSEDKALANKLLSEMKVTKAMAKKYAEPKTYKELEQTVFMPKLEHKRERGHHR
jgi:hypothetical protein